MESLFAKFCFFVLGGAVIASAVSGNGWPVICAVIALAILSRVFGALEGPGDNHSNDKRRKR